MLLFCVAKSIGELEYIHVYRYSKTINKAFSKVANLLDHVILTAWNRKLVFEDPFAEIQEEK